MALLDPDLVTYMPEKNYRKKKLSCDLWSEHDMSFLKKAEKTDFEPLQKAQISFS
jgi:hypothetical protein